MPPAPEPERRLTFSDFIRQIGELQKLGPLAKILKLAPIPFPGELSAFDEEEFRKQISQCEEFVAAMTAQERENPESLKDEAHRRVVAERAGVPFGDVNPVIEQYYEARRFFSTRSDSPPGHQSVASVTRNPIPQQDDCNVSEPRTLKLQRKKYAAWVIVIVSVAVLTAVAFGIYKIYSAMLPPELP